MNPPDYTSLPTRFWDKVEVDADTGCWNWTATKDRKGYGRWSATSENGRAAHRHAAIDRRGPVPPGYQVLHHCDNSSCIRPSHTYYGTDQDNTDDMMRRGRSAKGSRHSHAKLSEQDVIEIRRLYDGGEGTDHELAAQYSMSIRSIRQILRKERWTHV